MTKRQWFSAFAGVAVAAAAVAVGCSGGSPDTRPAPGVAGELSLTRAVRVAIRLNQPAVAGYLQRTPAAARQEAIAQGFRLEERRIVYPPFPAVGHYLRIGNLYIPSGPNAEFYIPKGLAVPAQVPLYKQRTDAQPIGTVQIANALRPGTATLQTVYLDLQGGHFGSAGTMDGVPRGRAAKACCSRRAVDDGCDRVDCDVHTNVREAGCCWDFDETKGRITGTDEADPADGTNLCIPQRVSEWVGSECYLWTYGSGTRTAACYNEKAYLQVTGPSCYDNHKYRYCQNMDGEDLVIAGEGTVTVTVDRIYAIGVHNNTAFYDTSVTLSGDAHGTLHESAGATISGNTAVIQHYDDSAQTYIADRRIVYRAPEELPDGQTEAFDTVTFTAGGQTRTVTIRVVQPCGQDEGRAGRPCS